VDEAATGEEALGLLRDGEYDVAFLDYRLPDIDGLTILQNIKQGGLQLMTCMITAYANIDTAIAATRQGSTSSCPNPSCPTIFSGSLRLLSATNRPALKQTGCAGSTRPACSNWPRRRPRPFADLFLARRRACGQPGRRRGAGQPGHDGPTGHDRVRGAASAAADLLREGPLAPLAEQLAAPQKDRTIGQLPWRAHLHDQHRDFRAEDGSALGRILTLSDISQVRRLAMEKSALSGPWCTS